MIIKPTKIPTIAGAILVLLLLSDSAQAFRCKSKLVRDGMHEQQVLAICGEPATKRHLGVALRSFHFVRRGVRHGGLASHRLYPGGPALSEEVVITEYVYNFGPRKLMRRLVFEGGVLVTIETIGYGYIEK